MKLPKFRLRWYVLLLSFVLSTVSFLVIIPHFSPQLNVSSDNFDVEFEAVAGILSPESSDTQYSEYLSNEISLVYDGTTIVLSTDTIDGFFSDQCIMKSKICNWDAPCVNQLTVNDYVKNMLSPVWKTNARKSVVDNQLGRFEYLSSDTSPDGNDAAIQIINTLNLRLNALKSIGCYLDDEDLSSSASDVISVSGIQAPGTDGSYAAKYIEVDQSQQHLYAWENGSLAMDYGVSGFFDQYEFYGIYSINNKAPNAWSPIAKKWMPYWMAYYYDPKQQAWLGIHELVYWYDEEGNYIEESSDSIGRKKSGGCIRLDRDGPAERLYNWTDVGIPVLIHP